MDRFSKQQIAQIAQKAIKQKAEVKSFDQGVALGISNTPIIQSLCDVPQGDLDTNRNGDQLEIVRYTAKINIVNSSTDTFNTMRCVLFRWNQDDTTAPVASDVLQATVGVFSNYNRDNLRAKKFTILDDWFECTSLNGEFAKTHTYDRQFNSKVKFQSSTTNGTGKLYYCIVSDSSANPHPFVSFIFRTWYTDI